MADPLAQLAEWMTPFTVTMNRETLAERRRVVEGVAASEELDAYTLVEAAHGHLTPAATDALATVVRSIDASVVLTGNEAFAATVAAAALAVRLSGDDAQAALVALLVESAAFLGLEPAIPDLRATAAATIASAGRRARARLEPANTPREVNTLLRAASASVGNGSDLEDVLKAVGKRDAALQALARRVESLVETLEERLQLLEEELDLLWWSRAARCRTDNQPWESVPPPRRAALAAAEIADHLARMPAPPSARALLRGALGPDADTETTIAAVGAEMPVGTSTDRRALMPLTTYRNIADSVGNDARAVAAAVESAALYLPPDATRPLIDAAEQALREIQIALL